jgi:hypothetical protein
VVVTYRRAVRFHFHHLAANQLLYNRSCHGFVAIQTSFRRARFVCQDHRSVLHVFLPKPLSASSEMDSKTRIDTSALCPNEQEGDIARTTSFAEKTSLIASNTVVRFSCGFLFSIGQSDRNSLALFSVLLPPTIVCW